MIGQKQLLQQIDRWVAIGDLPRFLIITGNKGSGKMLLAQKIAKRMGAFYVPCELGVDAVREVVENCYKCDGTTIYTFLNADKMSAQAKNALLKITEEPPRSAHFILTLQDPNATLETLRSRSVALAMEPYTEAELREYMDNTVNETILKIASTPGEVNDLRNIKVDDFFSFCEKVLDNIATVTGVNAFKIAQSLKFKEEDEGHDPILFMRCISAICFQRAKNASSAPYVRMNFNLLLATATCIRDLQLTGVKKESTVDCWILKVRDIIQGAS